ncbi:MAG: UDP-N-acetylmuramoyl-tripeptide--D-alanyl-D-alanine ligase [Actinobacteria bacterium]|nr:UDP-N-acetylmuramoyl-tripeptide--D-alanyl-D-alanine ligase [Actinomycetota bacterium]
MQTERMSGSIPVQVEELITLTAQEICDACAGELLAGDAASAVVDISTDTRADLAGKLFVALRGENFDGGEFVVEALSGGASGVLAERDAAGRAAATLSATVGGNGNGGNGNGNGGSGANANGTAVVIAVDDSGEALKGIASLVAARSGATVVAITGSTGKTSTKDMLSGLLSPKLDFVASRASFNNEVGVPLTLLSAAAGTEVIVVEMGMQSAGEISELCRIAAPDVAVITNVGPAHLEYAGSLENIARGKAEIAQGLPSGGGLVIPFGEALLAPHLQGLDLRQITFGFDELADIHPVFHEHAEDGRLHAVISCCGREIELWFNFAPHHHLLNAMAAIGAYHLLGLPLEDIPGAVENIHLGSLRGELIELPGDALLLNDCYNANPLSMRSSLEYLASVGTGRRTVAILGDMGELGTESEKFHQEVGRLISELGIDRLIAVGREAAGYVEGVKGAGACSGCCYYFADRSQALAEAPGLIRPGDVVLVKASRFMKLEELSEALAAGTATPAADTPGEGANQTPER